MISPLRKSSKPSAMYKSVHSANYQQNIPEGAVLLETLKTVEIQFQNREIIDQLSANCFNPIWFLAETERNVFLWRAGYSLVDEQEFEFWVDVDKLIEKRIKQIERGSSENPFINPLWGGHLISDPEVLEKEKNYLNTFLGALERIQSHASALSHVASQLRKEFVEDVPQREIVILPSIK